MALLGELEEDFSLEMCRELTREGKFSFLLHPRQREPMCKACGWEGALPGTDVVRDASQGPVGRTGAMHILVLKNKRGGQVVTHFLWAPSTSPLALFPSKSVAV